MKILLIGGTGVLSTGVAEEAVKCGHSIFLFNRGTQPHLLPKGTILIKGDIYDRRLVQSLLENHYFDVVMDFLTYNEKQIKEILNCIREKCNQYIFVSTATVYNKKNENEIITENTPAGNPKWSYAIDKTKSETYLKKHYKEYVPNYTIIRPYVTYGNTRIPFAVIPSGAQWTLANRIICNKPILLWDDGRAICTLTHTEDFSKAVVSLFGNENAYNQSFHITGDETLTWKKVTNEIGKALGEIPIIAGIPTDYIVRQEPRYGGVLRGDKSTNMRFDNTKIKAAIPDLAFQIPFSVGIKRTIAFYKANDFMQKIDYSWDGMCDRIIIGYYKSLRRPLPFSKKSVSVKAYPAKLTFAQKSKYYSGRYKALSRLFAFSAHVRGIFIGGASRLEKLLTAIFSKKGEV